MIDSVKKNIANPPPPEDNLESCKCPLTGEGSRTLSSRRCLMAEFERVSHNGGLKVHK